MDILGMILYLKLEVWHIAGHKGLENLVLVLRLTALVYHSAKQGSDTVGTIKRQNDRSISTNTHLMAQNTVH
jgi:hypothetical protein